MDGSLCQHHLKEMFLVFTLKFTVCFAVCGSVPLLYTHVPIDMCVFEFAGRCGQGKFQTNDGPWKSDNQVNTLSHPSHTYNAQDYCVWCVSVLAGSLDFITVSLQGGLNRAGKEKENALPSHSGLVENCSLLLPPPLILPRLHEWEAHIRVQEGRSGSWILILVLLTPLAQARGE